MGVSVSAHLVVGYQLASRDTSNTVTRYDEVTGEPYYKAIPGMEWVQVTGGKVVSGDLIESWWVEEAPGLRVFTSGDELREKIIIGLEVVKVDMDYGEWAYNVTASAIEDKCEKVMAYASERLGFHSRPETFLLMRAS